MCLAAVFLLKLIVLLPLKDHILTQADAGLDTTTYVALAERVLGGDVSLGPGLYFMSPLYIYFLAGVLGITGSFTVVRLLQIALGTCAVAFVFVMADEWYGRRAAWISSTLAALTGLFTFYESLLLQTALDPFLTAAAMTSLTLGFTRGGQRWFALAGLAFGLEALNRPNVILPVACMAVLVAATTRWRLAVVFAAGVGMALSPVIVRNIAVADEWSATASHGGLNFYIGNNAEADGTYHSVPGVTPNLDGQHEDTRRIAEQSTGRKLTDSEVSDYFYGLGWAWIREQPFAAGQLLLRKIAYLFNAERIWLNYSYPFFAREAGTLLGGLPVGSWLLVPLGIVGLVIAAPRLLRPQYLSWASFVPLYALAVAVFFVADRYTLPLLVVLSVAAGGAADALASAVTRRAWTQVAGASVAAVACLFVTLAVRPARATDGVEEERTRMAERLISLKRYDEAEQWASSAAAISARPGLVHFRVGQRLLAGGEPARALVHFESAQRADPGQPDVQFALGEALLDAGRPRDAIVHLRLAIASGVQNDVAGMDLVRALGAIGDQAGALHVLRGLHPVREDGEYWVALGELGMQLRDAVLAETFFRRAVAASPDLASGHFGLAAAAASTGRIDVARFELQETIRLDPNFERARQLQRTLQ
jgi:tetratricopeptide (TPR) repeat protein